jgi:hypothetical protein
VPDSATHQLAALTGTMNIVSADRQHLYRLEFPSGGALLRVHGSLDSSGLDH